MDKDQFYRALLDFDKEYVSFSAFAQILNKMTQTLQIYRQTGIVRNLVIIGESGCGKTSLARAFCSHYPRQHLLERTVTPAVYVEVPSIGTVGALARQILAGLGDPFPEKGRVIDQTARIEILIQNSKTEMLILDEAQHVYDRGQNKTQYATADWLKSLLNSIKIPVVLLGIPRLENLLQVNVQLRRRFSAPLVLSLGDPDDSEFFNTNYDVINALVPVLPLPLSRHGMTAAELTRRIYYATDGRVGYLKELLAQALERAWEVGGTEITRTDLAAAFTNIWSGSTGRLVARKVIMSHFAQSKTEPLFRKVSLLCAKADDASEGSVDVHPCTQGPRRIVARDRATPGHFPQYRNPLPGLARRTTLQVA